MAKPATVAEPPVTTAEIQPIVNGVVQTPPTPPEAPVVAAAAPALPEGYRRLSDTRKRAQDDYAPLRAFAGKFIQLDKVSLIAEGEGDARKISGGTMTFSQFTGEPPVEGETVPAFSCPIPRGALKAIVAAGTANPDDTIVCEVVQTKRGVALR